MRVWQCDRCGKVMEKLPEVLDNGLPFIKTAEPGGEEEDTDLCEECLQEFLSWWKAPPVSL